jgi:putative tryptophan/tyrosine transport system substrate-binding protein
MRRREFIVGLGSMAAWPCEAQAQQGERVRRIGVLMAWAENDPEAKGYLSAFTRGLAELGWTDGHNIRIEVRWAAANVDRARMFAKELVDLRPDVILATTTPMTAALQRETRTIPIVFVTVGDPVGSGFVAGLSRPSGNLTGFKSQEDTRNLAGDRNDAAVADANVREFDRRAVRKARVADDEIHHLAVELNREQTPCKDNRSLKL